MDVDREIPDDNDDSGGKRRLKEPDPAKVRLVTGPQREDYDNARDKEAFHKDQVLLAKQKNHKLALENQQLHAQLETAEKMKAKHIAYLKSMHQELASKSQAIVELQQHKGQLEAQFLGDQEKLQAMCSTIVPQLIESQKLLMQRNEDVERPHHLLVQKKDEAIQLRAYNYLQSKKAPQNKPPPRRGTRASLDPARNSSTRTIQIPLDPIPVTRAPSGKSNPQHKAKLAATPAFADLLSTDVDTLSSLIDKLERLLEISDDVTVNVKETAPKKRNAKKSQRLANRDLKNHINSVLRRATYDKFGVEQASDFQIYNPAEEAKVTACEEGLIDPADDLFQWDFSPGYAESRWNDLMIVKVVDAALEADGTGGGEIGEVSFRVEGIPAAFNESLGRIETMREARARGAQNFQQQQLGSRSTSSKHRKYENRVQTITATIQIKTDDGIAGDIETWERLLEMVEHLGEQGMSSEEEDEVEVDGAKVLIYKVKLCLWREPRVVEYLRFVDAQTALFKKNKRGPVAASRIRSGAPGSSKAPCGLPKSLYNGQWLKKATPSYLKELKVSKEAFGLFVAATERMAL
ncbi:hypothetical protein B0H17DRAFT_1147866 [Mycena rosella]|uniref:Uncharacterized protein n=1 Tax=Mycena rosella TaxID=1033263 RepID=A0AAD7FXR2_MYCRO|nr:hypothetical protein B0H17DRAFT_1147866 [Mycena rosella]